MSTPLILEIRTVEPTKSGRYACYLPGVGEATVIRTYLVGYGWFSNLHEKVSGAVAGWIGPLPGFPENSVKADPWKGHENDPMCPLPATEYDL